MGDDTDPAARPASEAGMNGKGDQEKNVTDKDVSDIKADSPSDVQDGFKASTEQETVHTRASPPRDPQPSRVTIPRLAIPHVHRPDNVASPHHVLHPKLNIGCLRGVYARNLFVPGERRLLDTRYTLVAHDGYRDARVCVYASEVVRDSLNPTWRPLCEGTLHHLTVFVRATSHIHVRVFEAKAGQGNGDDGCGDEPLIDKVIDLRALHPCSVPLKSLTNLPKNTLVFDFDHGLYLSDPPLHPVPAIAAGSAAPASNLSQQSNGAHGSGKKQASSAFILPLIRRVTKTIHSVSDEVSETTAALNAALASRRRRVPREDKKTRIMKRLSDLERGIETQRIVIRELTAHAARVRDAIAPRRATLERATKNLNLQRQQLREHRKDAKKGREKLARVERLVKTRRQQLVSQLIEVFPIEHYIPRSDKKMNERLNKGKGSAHKIMAICGLPLPNADFSPKSDEQISTALGYVAHLVMQLAKYYNVPLRYTIMFNSSLTQMRDDVYQHPTSNVFPLWMKNQQKARFEYAVFMLNKNVEQVINSQGLFVVSLRHTLPNLRSLLAASSGISGGASSTVPPSPSSQASPLTLRAQTPPADRNNREDDESHTVPATGRARIESSPLIPSPLTRPR